MLVEFRVSNFRSIKEEQVLSMVASSDTSHPDNVVEIGKLRLLKSAAIYGPNASGKTNLLKAFRAFVALVVSSSDSESRLNQYLMPFLLDSESRDGPSRFEATIVHEGVRYQYGFSASRERIHEEWLIAYPKGKPQSWFKRVMSCENQEDDYRFGSHLRGEKSVLSAKTRPDALFLSVATQWNHAQLSAVYEWFKRRPRYVGECFGELPPMTSEVLIRETEASDDDAKGTAAVLALLRKADPSVATATPRPYNIDDLRRILPNLSEEMLDKLKPAILRNAYRVTIEHQARDGANMELSLDEESSGLRHVYSMAMPWVSALKHGYSVVVDELESGLHTLLSRTLVDLFHGDLADRCGAQLIFSTHDTTLLDPELFRRDQIWFTEKNECGATELYSLAEYKPRKDEAFQRGYLSGRYGAIPVFGPLEDLVRSE